MVVSNDQWRAESLCFSKYEREKNRMFLKIFFLYVLTLFKVLNTDFWLSKFATRILFHWLAIIILSLLYLRSLLPLHGDIKSKPGPRNSKNHLPSFCHLSSLPARSFQKMLLLKAHNAMYKHDLICLSESYLDTMIPSDHISLDLEGYKLVCADHPSNVKQGGICMYYKEPLPVRVINLPYHQEALPL